MSTTQTTVTETTVTETPRTGGDYSTALYGDLCLAETGETLRAASALECAESILAGLVDGGPGIILPPQLDSAIRWCMSAARVR